MKNVDSALYEVLEGLNSYYCTYYGKDIRCESFPNKDNASKDLSDENLSVIHRNFRTIIENNFGEHINKLKNIKNLRFQINYSNNKKYFTSNNESKINICMYYNEINRGQSCNSDLNDDEEKNFSKAFKEILNLGNSDEAVMISYKSTENTFDLSDVQYRKSQYEQSSSFMGNENIKKELKILLNEFFNSRLFGWWFNKDHGIFIFFPSSHSVIWNHYETSINPKVLNKEIVIKK